MFSKQIPDFQFFIGLDCFSNKIDKQHCTDLSYKWDASDNHV